MATFDYDDYPLEAQQLLDNFIYPADQLISPDACEQIIAEWYSAVEHAESSGLLGDEYELHLDNIADRLYQEHGTSEFIYDLIDNIG